MTVLVTGGAGFIGSHIVDGLIREGYEVVVIDNLSTGFREHLNPAAVFYQLDINDNGLKHIFKKYDFDYVIHHAAQIDVQRSVENPVFDAENNILGTLKLLECCRRFKVKKVIYASSAAVYGEPAYLGIDEEHPIGAFSPYGISKHTPEHYLQMYSRLYGLKYTIFRYSNVYGPRQDPRGEGGVISIFVDRMLAGKPPLIHGDGEQTRDFIYVQDIVRANLMALKAADNQLLNISCSTRHSIKDLVDVINKIMGTDFKPQFTPARTGDIRHSYLLNDKARKVLNWEPIYSLEQGLRLTIDYYRKLAEEVAAGSD